MRHRLSAAILLATTLPVEAAFAQAGNTILVPTGTSAPAVAQEPVSDDSAEDIAKDAARDLKDSRFYNRPGATRAQYDADWQTCRLIARGSRTPSGTIPYYYNPAVISPLAAGVGAGLGGLFANMIAQGQQRRANRRSCLLIKGWRLVEVPSVTALKVGAMTDAQRSDYFDTIVGADKVEGEITERTSFALPADSYLRLDAPLTGPGSLYLGKKVDPAAPFALAPGEAAVVLGFRRPDEGSAGRSGTLSIARYDVAGRDLVYRPKDWKKKGDKTTYSLNVATKDRKLPYEVQVLRMTPGDYVLMGSAVGKLPVSNSYCFGAPTFHVGEGEVLYLGDFVPYLDARMSNGAKLNAIAWAAHMEDARHVLSGKQASLASALKPVTLRNRATYACSAISMDRWDLPGMEALPDPEPQPAPAAVTTIGG
jgi:hypothetical protein